MKFLRVTGSHTIAKKYNQWYMLWWNEVHWDVLKIQNVYYDRWFKLLSTKELIPLYDVYRVGWLEGIYKIMVTAFMYYYAILKGRYFLDPISTSCGMYTKLFQQLIFDDMQCPSLKTMAFCVSWTTKEHVAKIIDESFDFPLVIKNPSLDRWLWVEKINTPKDLDIYLHNILSKKLERCILVQEFYPASHDYRALVVGDKVVGVFQRSNPDSFKHNISQWGTGKSVQISSSMASLFVQATKSVGLDVWWVDFFRDGGEKVVLIEINRMPQYTWFENTTEKKFLPMLHDFLASKKVYILLTYLITHTTQMC
jgi:hypothetical protein